MPAVVVVLVAGGASKETARRGRRRRLRGLLRALAGGSLLGVEEADGARLLRVASFFLLHVRCARPRVSIPELDVVRGRLLGPGRRRRRYASCCPRRCIAPATVARASPTSRPSFIDAARSAPRRVGATTAGDRSLFVAPCVSVPAPQPRRRPIGASPWGSSRGKTRRRAVDAERGVGVVVVVVAILEKYVARRRSRRRFFLTDDYVVQASEHVCGRRLHLPSFTQSLPVSVKI